MLAESSTTTQKVTRPENGQTQTTDKQLSKWKAALYCTGYHLTPPLGQHSLTGKLASNIELQYLTTFVMA